MVSSSMISCLTVVISAVVVGASADYCTLLNRTSSIFPTPFVRPSTVVACLELIKVDPARDVPVLDDIIKTLKTFYFFQYGAQDQPDPMLPGRYDVIAALTKLRNRVRTFTAAWRLYATISQQIALLNDGHTGYFSGCFMPSSFYLPLPLVSVVEGGAPVIRVASLTFTGSIPYASAKKRPFYFDMALYAGAKVLSVRGVPAMVYLARMAQTSGYARSVATRFNNLFAALQFQYDFESNSYSLVPTPGGFAASLFPPAADFITVTLIRSGSTAPENVRVPWMASGVTGFSSAATFLSNCFPNSCTFPPSNTRKRTGGAKGALENRRVFLPGRDLRVKDVEQAFRVNGVDRSARDALNSQPSLVGAYTLSPAGDYFQVFLLADRQTAVVSIPDFGGDTHSAMQSAAALLKRHGAKKVLFDVRGNPGGSVQEAWSLVRQLVGSAKTPLSRLSYPLQLIQGNDVISAMVAAAAGLYDATLFDTVAQKQFVSQAGFFFPIRREQWAKGETRGNYSSFFKPHIDSLVYSAPEPPALGKIPFGVLSDSECYSSCALLVNALKTDHNVTVVTVGGPPGSTVPTSTTCGGVSVGNVWDLVCSIPESAAHLPYAPGAITYGTLGIGWASVRIPASSPIPCEFQFYRGDAHIPFTFASVTNPAALWKDAARFI